MFKVTDNRTNDHFPSYSPDDKKIAYSRYSYINGEDDEIYTINVRGGDRVQLTNNARNDIAPFYSPDGNKIAYACTTVRITVRTREICTMEVDGRGRSQVTVSKYEAIGPSWGSRPQ